MKSTLFIILISICLVNPLDNRMKPKVENSISYDRMDSLKIIKIEALKDVYLIQAKRNDSLFKFVSYKSNNNSKCKSIVEGSCYDIELTSYFDLDYSLEKAEFFVVGDEVVIDLEEKTHNNLYIAKNLKGLCQTNIQPK